MGGESFLTAIGTAVPEFEISQNQIADFMCNMVDLTTEEASRLRLLYARSGIERRHSVLADYARERGDFSFFSNGICNQVAPGVGARMEVFRQSALPLAHQAVRDCLGQRADLQANHITDLIAVSCTGMYAPGLDIELVQALGLPGSTHRYGLNFMGCYAAFPALKLADAIVRADPSRKVLLVCLELCTLHFQHAKQADFILSNALFSDGAAAVLIEGGVPPEGPALLLRTFQSDLNTVGQGDMAWEIGDNGFLMTLSKYVSALVQGGVGELTQRLFQTVGMRREDIAFWAIHPGGKRILDACQSALGLSDEQLLTSRGVLANYGNMSSATILFVLAEIFHGLTADNHGESVLCMAFGPGLTMESAILRVTHA